MKKFVRTLFLLFAIIFISIAGTLTYQGYKVYDEAIQQEPVATKFDELRSRENYTQFEDLPQMYIDAVLTIEDKRFFKHPGIDVFAIGRALWNDILAMAPIEGGSTITQQVSKNAYFTQDKEITRKIAEVFMSHQIEKTYTKEEIFEIYVNSIFFGDGHSGIYEASMGYYGVPPKELTDFEATMLAGVPNAPSVYAPTINYNLAMQRQQQVLYRLEKNKKITAEDAKKIKEQQTRDRLITN